MECNLPLFFCLSAIPYTSCLHILAMERFLHVFDKKFGVDAEDFFLEGIFYMMYFGHDLSSLLSRNLDFNPCVIPAR